MTRRSALIVANYAYDDERLRQLTSPESDAAELSRVLGDPEIGGFDVRIVVNQPHFVVRREIDSFFRDRSRDELLLLYFSGHGVKDEDGLLYLATADTQRDWLASTAVEAQFVHRAMEKSLSRRQILILDCCYSGAFGQSLLTKSDTGIATGEQFGGRGRVVLTASDAVQFAFEGPATGEVETSVFTSALVEGIETGAADLNHDGFIDVDEWYSYAHERIASQTANQRPSKWSLDVRGSLVVARNIHADPIKVGLPPELLQAIRSPFAGVREGAVAELATLLTSYEVDQSRAARLALEQLADDDSRRVSAAVQRVLAGVTGEQIDPVGLSEWPRPTDHDAMPQYSVADSPVDAPAPAPASAPEASVGELEPVMVDPLEDVSLTPDQAAADLPDDERGAAKSSRMEALQRGRSGVTASLEQKAEPENGEAPVPHDGAEAETGVSTVPDMASVERHGSELAPKGTDTAAPERPPRMNPGTVRRSGSPASPVGIHIAQPAQSTRRAYRRRKAVMLFMAVGLLAALGLGGATVAWKFYSGFGDDDKVGAGAGMSDVSAVVPIYRAALRHLTLPGVSEAVGAGISIDESNSRTSVYTFATNLDYLVRYYEDALRSDGWEIHRSQLLADGESHLITATSGGKVATYVLGRTRTVTEAFDVITQQIPSSAQLRTNMFILYEIACTEGSIDRCVDPFVATLTN